jgi:hypothetical protein
MSSSAVIVYAIVDAALSPDFPLGDALEVTKVLAGQARLTFPAESRNLSSCGRLGVHSLS